MTAPNVRPPDSHEAALLLPWYLNRTLSEPERRRVEEHLLGCESCRAELKVTAALRRRMQDMLAAAPSPSANLRAQVMRRLAEERAAMTARAAAPARAPARPARHAPAAAGGLADFFRNLLQPRWAPAAAALLILLQAGGLAWFALDPATPGPQPSAPRVIPRSVEPAAATRIRIVFNPRATEAEIRTALRTLGGRIVDGPGDDAAYVVQLPSESPAVVARRLKELRERPGLVERIEHAP